MSKSAQTRNKGWKGGFLREQRLTVSEWADEHRILSQKSSSEAGKWRTDRTPYLREIMDCLSSSNFIQRVVVMAGAQIGKSETGNNWLGYIVHHAPAPMLIVQPTVDLAKRFSKQRIQPMIDETPALKDRIAESRERDSGNTVLSKEFKGGIVILTGANSAVGLRSMPVRYLFLDEVDAYPQDINGEGDPIKLAERRTTTFARRKILITSTPTIKDVSRIEHEYNNSDKRRYYVPCPHCDNYDWIKWKNMRWQNDDPKTVQLLCESCGCFIEENKKNEMLLRGKWIAESASFDGKTAGFHLSSLYSPVGWKSWVEIVSEFIAAKNDPARLKEWVNTVLAETWEEAYSSKIESSVVSERAEPYKVLTIPSGGLILTAGVDVQDNRIAVKVKAWGENEESWLVNWMEIYGDPSDLSPTGVWAQVDSVLKQTYKHENGKDMKVRAAAVDTGGHYTHETYVFCRQQKPYGVIAIKGSSMSGKPILGKPSRQDINYKNQVIKNGVDLWMVGTDTAKAVIYGRLKLGKDGGQGAMHFPLGLSEEYYSQLTSEKQVTKYINGFPKRVWVKKDNARNEALDCEVYSYAALQYLYTRHNRNLIWLQAKKLLDKITEGGIPEKKDETVADNTHTETPTPNQHPPRRPNPPARGYRRPSFVNRW